MILVDTSIWISFFRPPVSPIDKLLQEKILEEDVSVCGIILTELYQGCRTPKELQEIEGYLEVIPVFEEKADTFRRAGKMASHINRTGVKISAIDAVIAQVALDAQVSVWSLDKHFATIAKYTNLVSHPLSSFK